MEADDKLNENNKNNKNNDKASVVFIFQVIAWIVAIGPIFGDYTWRLYRVRPRRKWNVRRVKYTIYYSSSFDFCFL